MGRVALPRRAVLEVPPLRRGVEDHAGRVPGPVPLRLRHLGRDEKQGGQVHVGAAQGDGVRRGDLAHAQGPEDARLHVRLEGHGERAAGGLRTSCREGGLRLEGVCQADEEGPSLPCRGVLRGPLCSFNFPCRYPYNVGVRVWLFWWSFVALALAPLSICGL